MDESIVTYEQGGASPLSEAKYFGVSTQRFALYLLISLGLWIMYWFYRNWQAINRAGYKKQFKAFWRAVFCVYTAYSLSDKILQGAKKTGYNGNYDAKSIGIAVIVLSIISRGLNNAPEKFLQAGIGGVATIVPMVFLAVTIVLTLLPALILQPVGQAIDYLKQQQGRQKDDDNALTAGQIIIFTVGILLWLISFAAGMMPKA